MTASIRYFAKKYPKLPLKETTVRRLRNLYQSALKSRKSESSRTSSEDHEDPSKEVEELPRKKTGRPLLIGDELDTQLQEYVRHVRKRGLAINSSIVIAAGSGIIMNQDANQLSNAGGRIKLTDDWAKNLLKRMGFVK